MKPILGLISRNTKTGDCFMITDSVLKGFRLVVSNGVPVLWFCVLCTGFLKGDGRLTGRPNTEVRTWE